MQCDSEGQDGEQGEDYSYRRQASEEPSSSDIVASSDPVEASRASTEAARSDENQGDGESRVEEVAGGGEGEEARAVGSGSE